MRVYLAGQITGLTYDDAQGWRDYVAAALADVGITAYSPLRAQAMLRAHAELDNGGSGSSYVDTHPLLSASGMTARDRYDVQKADVMLANLLGMERASIGTSIELGWADAYRVPTVVAMEPGNVHDHAMVRSIASYIVHDLDTALDCIKGVLLP